MNELTEEQKLDKVLSAAKSVLIAGGVPDRIIWSEIAKQLAPESASTNLQNNLLGIYIGKLVEDGYVYAEQIEYNYCVATSKGYFYHGYESDFIDEQMRRSLAKLEESNRKRIEKDLIDLNKKVVFWTKVASVAAFLVFIWSVLDRLFFAEKHIF